MWVGWLVSGTCPWQIQLFPRLALAGVSWTYRNFCTPHQEDLQSVESARQSAITAGIQIPASLFSWHWLLFVFLNQNVSSCTGGFLFLLECPVWKTGRTGPWPFNVYGCNWPFSSTVGWKRNIKDLEMCLMSTNSVWAVRMQSSFECICVPSLSSQSFHVRSSGLADTLAVG